MGRFLQPQSTTIQEKKMWIEKALGKWTLIKDEENPGLEVIRGLAGQLNILNSCALGSSVHQMSLRRQTPKGYWW